jgi:heme-degrading monooxygenase HmoA
MMAVIFEVVPAGEAARASYLDIAAQLRPLLEKVDGFLSIERFESLSAFGKILSLSYWRDDEAVAAWRNLEPHRTAQEAGPRRPVYDYRLRIPTVVRDYSMDDRAQVPVDRRAIHG